MESVHKVEPLTQPTSKGFLLSAVLVFASVFLIFGYVKFTLNKSKISPSLFYTSSLPSQITVLTSLNLGDAALLELFDTEAHYKVSIIAAPLSKNEVPAQLPNVRLIESLIQFREKKIIEPGMSASLLKFALAQVEPLTATKIREASLVLRGTSRTVQQFETTKSANYFAYFDNNADTQWLVLVLKKGEAINPETISPLLNAISPRIELFLKNADVTE